MDHHLKHHPSKDHQYTEASQKEAPTIKNIGNIVLWGGGPEILMASVELHLIELISVMAEFRRYLTTSEVISLCNDLVHGVSTEIIKKRRFAILGIK